MSTNPDKSQLVADGIVKDFNFTFEIPLNRTVLVYKTLDGKPADEELDLISPNEFIVILTNPSLPVSTGLVRFNIAPVDLSIITITPDQETDVSYLFSDTKPFLTDDLNGAFDQESISQSYNLNNYLVNCIRYNLNENDSAINYDNKVSPLSVNGFWRRAEDSIISQDYNEFIEEVAIDINTGTASGGLSELRIVATAGQTEVDLIDYSVDPNTAWTVPAESFQVYVSGLKTPEDAAYSPPGTIPPDSSDHPWTFSEQIVPSLGNPSKVIFDNPLVAGQDVLIIRAQAGALSSSMLTDSSNAVFNNNSKVLGRTFENTTPTNYTDYNLISTSFPQSKGSLIAADAVDVFKNLPVVGQLTSGFETRIYNGNDSFSGQMVMGEDSSTVDVSNLHLYARTNYSVGQEDQIEANWTNWRELPTYSYYEPSTGQSKVIDTDIAPFSLDNLDENFLGLFTTSGNNGWEDMPLGLDNNGLVQVDALGNTGLLRQTYMINTLVPIETYDSWFRIRLTSGQWQPWKLISQSADNGSMYSKIFPKSLSENGNFSQLECLGLSLLRSEIDNDDLSNNLPKEGPWSHQTLNFVSGSGDIKGIGSEPNHTVMHLCTGNVGLGEIFRSTDNGVTWVSTTQPANPAGYNCLYCASDSTVFIGGDGGRVYISTDGGQTYSNTLVSNLGHITGIWASETGKVIAVSSSGSARISTSIDNGVTWVPNAGAPNIAVKPSFGCYVNHDATFWAVVQDDGIVLTSLDGTNWIATIGRKLDSTGIRLPGNNLKISGDRLSKSLVIVSDKGEFINVSHNFADSFHDRRIISGDNNNNTFSLFSTCTSRNGELMYVMGDFITFKKSIDGGVTWTNIGNSSSIKNNIFPHSCHITDDVQHYFIGYAGGVIGRSTRDISLDTPIINRFTSVNTKFVGN